ncbi:MAG: phage tail assembly chaperone [Desulfovibrionales bacterium]|nr:phage tail assembly chaperone [Desulfovibrionales bacterium]
MQVKYTSHSGWVEVVDNEIVTYMESSAPQVVQFVADGGVIQDYVEPVMTSSEVRSKRDELLRQSDWSVLPDAPLTDAKKLEWKTYRQKLRDIPQHSGFPKNVVFPDSPAK